ncbi:N-acetylmuramic acid 6-phosphate etherase [Frondihabitans sucicola]|uniref:N-acetylmuramic acid 6-phosphate etherase n=1 Tax=Frondihabitans sucicola TaxID=1268041 RepID=UPI003D9AE4B0
MGALGEAKRSGALVVSVACNSPSRIAALADVAIEVVTGPEFIAGSTRLGAATAQKLVLNMLSTLTMVRLGKTYGNVMIDLQATNEKLVARSRRTVSAVTGADPHAAADALEAAGGSVKGAVLALKTRLSPGDAAKLLEANNGHLRDALRDFDLHG